MLLALILSLSLADPSITGVVKDTDGGAISGASVVVRSDAGEQQTVVQGEEIVELHLVDDDTAGL